MTITFHVPGIPRPQGSKRHVGRGVMIEQSPHVGNWRALASIIAKQAMNGRPMLDGEVHLSVTFVFPRPKKHAKMKESPMWHSSPPDVSKLIRAVEDSMSGIVFVDDRKIVSVYGEKQYAREGKEPGAYIEVTSE